MLVLWLVVVLAILGARVTTSARSSTFIAGNLRARTSAKYAAESGIVFGAARLRSALSAVTDPAERAAFLNSLETKGSSGDEIALGDARFMVVFVDANSRLDVNNASRAQLARLFSFFTGPVEAARAADAVRMRIGGEDVLPGERRRFSGQRTDLSYPALRPPSPLRSLEELRAIPSLPEHVAFAAAPFLTVDGDGRINRATASDTVLAVATGSLVDEPSRLIVIARGWVRGNPLTHEIQAVYAIDGKSMMLVRWQERDL